VSALDQWRAELAGWAIPDEILANAPEPPWGFPVELFRADVERADTPSRDIAHEALPDGGSVLDVGCGGGAASFALVPPAGRVVGVDSTPDMLTEYAAQAERCGVEHDEIAGTWPDVATQVGITDVVACHHVFYNVADLPPFVAALTAAAKRRVVVELTATHPLTASAPLWRHFRHRSTGRSNGRARGGSAARGRSRAALEGVVAAAARRATGGLRAAEPSPAVPAGRCRAGGRPLDGRLGRRLAGGRDDLVGHHLMVPRNQRVGAGV